MDDKDHKFLQENKIPYEYNGVIICTNVHRNGPYYFTAMDKKPPSHTEYHWYPLNFFVINGKFDPKTREMKSLETSDKKFLTLPENNFPLINKFGHIVLKLPTLVFAKFSYSDFCVYAHCDSKTGELSSLTDEDILFCIENNIAYKLDNKQKYQFMEIEYECTIHMMKETCAAKLAPCGPVSRPNVIKKTFVKKGILKIHKATNPRLVEYRIKKEIKTHIAEDIEIVGLVYNIEVSIVDDKSSPPQQQVEEAEY